MPIDNKKKYEIFRGLAQAAADGYDGAYDSDGKSIKIGLRREKRDPVLERERVLMDGFNISFYGDLVCVKYHSEVLLKELHQSNRFESEVEQSIADIVKFLQKRYKEITGKGIRMSPVDEVDIQAESMNRIRSWIRAKRHFKVAGLKKEPDNFEEYDPETKIRNITKKFLSLR